jgi:hypothetical protein
MEEVETGERYGAVPPLPEPPPIAVGAVSKNVVAAALEVAYEGGCELMLIASRRQVDRPALGGGYTEGWGPADLVEYVRQRDPEMRVTICRDHGGPWQHPTDAGRGEAEVMRSALDTFEADIDAGFGAIHIDTTDGPAGEVPLPDAIRRLAALYRAVSELAAARAASVGLEISLATEAEAVCSPDTLKSRLERFTAAVREDGTLPPPRFVVVGTGTKIAGLRNAGAVNDPERRAAALRRLRALVDVARDHAIDLKAHNCDYLSSEGWAVLRSAGIRSANVAPEYGVAESRAFLATLQDTGLHDLATHFLELAYASRAWCKWRDPARRHTHRELALMAGHYVFSTEECRRIRDRAARRLEGGQAELDERLRTPVRRAICSHVAALASREPAHAAAG